MAGIEWLFWPFGIIVFLIAAFIGKGRLGGKRTLFIILISLLFILVGNFGGDVAAGYFTSQHSVTLMDTVKSGFLLLVGIIGLAFMTFLRQENTEDIGYSLGLGGFLQAIVGIIGLAWNQGNEVKFAIAVIALVIVCWLFYKYRPYLLGQEDPAAKKQSK